ncbi:hypothetical protein APY03_5812 [Variovorax sp. WDL1]|nr:hypothetical protein APY03_5812 [Variovorax sp. WDL1]
MNASTGWKTLRAARRQRTSRHEPPVRRRPAPGSYPATLCACWQLPQLRRRAQLSQAGEAMIVRERAKPKGPVQ